MKYYEILEEERIEDCKKTAFLPTKLEEMNKVFVITTDDTDGSDLSADFFGILNKHQTRIEFNDDFNKIFVFIGREREPIFKPLKDEVTITNVFQRALLMFYSSLFPQLIHCKTGYHYRKILQNTKNALLKVYLICSIFTIDEIKYGELAPKFEESISGNNFVDIINIDKLGEYTHNLENERRTITIDDKKIKRIYEKEHETIEALVLFHEIGHSATDSNCFNSYGLTNPRDRELQANYISSLFTLGVFDENLEKINNDSKLSDYINPILYSQAKIDWKELLFIR